MKKLDPNFNFKLSDVLEKNVPDIRVRYKGLIYTSDNFETVNDRLTVFDFHVTIDLMKHLDEKAR